MAREFDDVEELRRALFNDLYNAVLKEVVKEMKDIEKETIEERVYAVFSPKEYKRRYSNGGLIAEENMQEEIRANGNDITVEITNITRGNESQCKDYYRGYIQPIVEEGYYIWNGEMPPPRPFIDETQSVIDTTDRIDKIIERVLKSMGW